MDNYSICFSHAAAILTAIAYLVKDILWLRILSVLACLSGILFNYLAFTSPLWAQIFWNGVFAAINIVQIALIFRERAGVSFSEEEKELYETMFQSFAPFEFMKLLRVGHWREAKKDEILAVEDQPIEDVKLIYNGLVNVEAKGHIVAQLRDGSFIGEISFLRGGDATATVRAERPTRYLSWSKVDLNKLLNRNPSMRFAMQSVISADLTKKLVR
jgi:hypothetical protein